MIMDKNKRILQFIYNVDFINAKKLFDELSEAEKSDLIIMESCTSNSLIVIGFIYFLLSKENTCFNHELASQALIQMSWIEGAYNLAYWHATEMLKLEPTLKNKEFMLLFYNIPEKILSEEYARKLAKDILQQDINNKLALSIILDSPK